ncbi:MAG: class A beta-lactamase [Alphaproteobacteria bacterium]|nr:class A beta-lactamase [Alphaproteobacteria bacterium]
MNPTRRMLLTLGAGAALSSCSTAPTLEERGRFEVMEGRLGGGRLGAFIIDTQSGLTLSYRPHERFAMSSTFKWILAAAVLELCDRGVVSLDDTLSFAEADLLSYSPVLRDRLSRLGGRVSASMSLEELCSSIVITSDNAAANLLMNHVLPPAGVTRFLRRIGDDFTRLDRLEPFLNENASEDLRDTTTPQAMGRSLSRVMTGRVLSPRSESLLSAWLQSSTTGHSRLRAGLPASWRAGDKTGTGSNGAHNDVGVVWPPGRRPIFIACFISEGSAPSSERDRVHAEVANLACREVLDFDPNGAASLACV